MKLVAASALAGLSSDDKLNEDYIIPKPFDKRVAPAAAKAVEHFQGELFLCNFYVQVGMKKIFENI